MPSAPKGPLPSLMRPPSEDPDAPRSSMVEGKGQLGVLGQARTLWPRPAGAECALI